MMKYPDYDEFPIDEIIYGCHAPFVGMGVYTINRKFSWPDPECTTENEYNAWAAHLKSEGYDIPEKYKDAFYK